MRLINADELKKNFQDELCKGIACAECSMQAEGFCRVERWIDIAPTIEAEPKHGRWITVSDGYGNGVATASICECSLCKDTIWVYKNDKRKWKFCPNCGAKMDE